MPSLMRRVAASSSLAVASALLSWSQVSPARAAEGFSIEMFEPQPGRALLGMGTSDVLDHTQLALHLFGHFQDDPLTLVSASDRSEVTARLVDERWTLEVLAAIGLFDLFQVELALPIVLSQSGSDLAALGMAGASVDGATIGDVRVGLRARIVDTRSSRDAAGFGLALAVPIAVPTGDAGQLASDGGVRVRPTLALDYGGPAWRVALEVGYDLRSDRGYVSYTADDQLRWSLGGRVPLGTDLLRLLATVQGSVNVGEQPIEDAATHPVEAFGALELATSGVVVTAGGGAAIVRGVGSPDVRAFIGLAWISSPGGGGGDGGDGDDGDKPVDTDGDGLVDDADKCRDFAEDHDGFQDHDGCPDPDDDIDGIPDVNDKCPDQPEDYAGVEDGCPNRDQDGDGVVDDADKCPTEAEDKDGFEDDDGCPDLDDDQDGVPDAADRCKALPETKNGLLDDDGCPDTTEKDVVITGEAIEIKQSIIFPRDSDKISAKSFAILDAVARVLVANPFIKRVSIEGHTDSEGPEAANLELSARRAASVLAYLVEHGVAAERVESKGFGEGRPLKPNTTPAGRAANRRVEFRIVDPAPAAPPKGP